MVLVGLPKTASVSVTDPMQVKSLRRPVSTRQLSKKEQIILLKASKINGFVFPPWKDPPVSSEFDDEADPFMYVSFLCPTYPAI
jgi:hypothetical protein